MGTIVRAISKDGSVVCSVIDSTDIVFRAERIHRPSATITAALGRLLSAGALMGCQLKDADSSITLRLKGNGPVDTIIVTSDYHGNVRGYPVNNIVELPLNQYGKLDVAGAVGNEGFLYVMRDLGVGEPYIGSSPIVSGEIAEDITHYYAISEQIPTVCGLGVLVNPDLTVQSAGGYLVQLLPGAVEESIAQLEKNIDALPPISTMIAQKMTSEQICEKILEGLNPNILDVSQAEYRCSCTRERVEKALISLGREELSEMADAVTKTGKPTEVVCPFCNKNYRLNAEELRNLLG